MKKAALIIGLVTAQAFAIGAFAQTTPTDPLALPNKPHLNVKPGPASTTAEGTAVADPKTAKPAVAGQPAKKMSKQERKDAREQREKDAKASPGGRATSPLYPNAVGSASTGPK